MVSRITLVSQAIVGKYNCLVSLGSRRYLRSLELSQAVVGNTTTFYSGYEPTSLTRKFSKLGAGASGFPYSCLGYSSFKALLAWLRVNITGQHEESNAVRLFLSMPLCRHRCLPCTGNTTVVFSTSIF
jgi:hypothetical protein